MNYNDELCCEMMSPGWLDNKWVLYDGYIEVLQVLVDNLRSPGIGETLPKFWLIPTHTHTHTHTYIYIYIYTPKL
jgi:hypothetical protein